MQTLFFIIAVVCSLMSQLPSLLKSDASGFLKLFWLPVGIMVLWSSARYFVGRPMRIWYAFLGVFTLYLIIMSVITTNRYFGSDLTNICISLLICAVAFSFWKTNANPISLKIIVWVIVLSGVIFAITLYFSSLSSIDITSRYEVYKSKNSAAQIILACGLVGYCCLKPKKIISKSFLYGIFIFLIFIVFILRSRASIASLLYVFVYIAFGSRNKKARIIFVSITAITLILILSTPKYYNIIVENILFNNRNYNSVDDLASGRITILSNYWGQYIERPMTGLGNFYIDCFPLSILMQYGVIGFIIVTVFISKMLLKTWKVRKSSMMGECAFLLFSAYLVNSLFEAQPPFGPGVKCFLVWIFIGFAMTNKKWTESKSQKTKHIFTIKPNRIH